jgi:hypothetical protein
LTNEKTNKLVLDWSGFYFWTAETNFTQTNLFRFDFLKNEKKYQELSKLLSQRFTQISTFGYMVLMDIFASQCLSIFGLEFDYCFEFINRLFMVSLLQFFLNFWTCLEQQHCIELYPAVSQVQFFIFDSQQRKGA